MAESLSISEMKKYLPPSFTGDILLLETTTSTNEEAKQIAKKHAAHGTVVFAKTQTAGRGRLGKSFLSPSGGLYFSMILHLPPESVIFLTASAAVGVCRAIEKCSSVRPEIKWVNDIFVNGYKVGGILTEQTPEGAIILGIGMNYTTAPEVENAGTLFSSDVPDRNKFAGTLLAELLNVFQDRTNIFSEYKSRSCVLGKQIRFLENNIWHNAKACDIDKSGGLVVELETGEKKVLCSGEISLRLRP